MKLLYFLAFIFLSYSKGFSQELFLKEYNTYIKVKNCQDTLKQSTLDGRLLVLYLKECKGEMDILVFENNRLIEKGSYENSLDTLKGYLLQKGIPSGNKKIVVNKYFEPLRNGKWMLYDKKKKSVYFAVFKDGILVE